MTTAKQGQERSSGTNPNAMAISRARTTLRTFFPFLTVPGSACPDLLHPLTELDMLPSRSGISRPVITSLRPSRENHPSEVEVEVIDLASEDSEVEQAFQETMNRAEHRQRDQGEGLIENRGQGGITNSAGNGDDDEEEEEISFQGSTGPRTRRFGRTLEGVLGDANRSSQVLEQPSNTTSSDSTSYPQEPFIPPNILDGSDDILVYDAPLSPPKVVQRIPTRKGFSRSFELELGGFIDSDDDEDKVKLEGEAQSPLLQSPKKKKQKLSKIHQGLTFACSGCERPLLLNAETAGRKVYALACGHLIDGYCLSLLSTPSRTSSNASKHTSKPSLPRSSSIFPKSHSSSLSARSAKLALKKAQTHRYICPVEGCGKSYYSDLVEQPEILKPGVDLSKDPEMLWKVRFGSSGVTPVYV